MWVVLIGVIWVICMWFLPVQVHVHFRQHALAAQVEVRIRVVLFTLHRRINISDKVAMALEHLWKRWRAKGEPVKVPLQKTIRRVPRKRIQRAVQAPLRWLGARVRCKRLAIEAEVGGLDAMESALLAGAGWAIVGAVLGIFSRMVQVDPSVPQVAIVPNYGGPVWRLESDCILRYRVGHAMVAGVWLLYRVARDREVVAWARDSWRRKGVEGSGRASDPGLDEDGHGEP